MTAIHPVWHPGWSVRNATLDEQHIEMLQMVQCLRDRCGLRGEGAVLDGLREVALLAAQHCAIEEDVLAANGFEGIEQHREEHRAGLARIAQVVGLLARRELPALDACQCVARWLESHLVDDDLPARAWMREPGTPEERHRPTQFDDRQAGTLS